MKRLSYKKIISVFLSLMMLAGNTQVHAEELPPEETTPEETILVEELPADEQVPAEVQEEDEEEVVVLAGNEEPDEPADETETDETTESVVEEVNEVQTLTVNEDGPVFDLPEQLFLPVWYEKQYELPFTLADGYNAADIVWSTDNDNVALIEEKDGVLYLSTKQEGETVITGSLNTGDGEVSDSVHVITAHWFEPSIPGMMFEAPGGDPKTFTVMAINAAAEMNYTVYSKDPAIASVSVSGDGSTKTVTITAVTPGTTELYARITDPNDPAKELDNTFLGVIVCDPEAVLEDLKILSLDDEEITELYLQTGDDPTWVTADIYPGTILPDKLLMSSTDPEVAYATHGPAELPPSLFFIHAGNKAGTADITFYMEGSDVNVVIHVTVEKGEPEFSISEELYLPIWYDNGYELTVYLSEEFELDDIEWTTEDEGIAWIEKREGIPYVVTDMSGETTITGTIHTENGDLSDSVLVHVDNWFETDCPGMMFERPEGSQTFHIRAVNQASGKYYEVYAQDTNVAEITVTGEGDEKTVTVTPAGPGMTVLAVHMQDPNQPDFFLENNILMDVIVGDPNAVPESINVRRTDNGPIDDIHLRTSGDPLWVVLDIEPKSVLPDRIAFESDYPEVAYVTEGPEFLSPYLFQVFPGSEEGNAVITFHINNSDVSVSLNVTVEKTIFSFGHNDMVVPEWENYTLDYILDYPGATLDDITWETDNNDRAEIEVNGSTVELFTYNSGPVHLTGILRMDGEEIARHEINVNIVQWFDSSTSFVKFADQNAEPQSVWLAPEGPVKNRGMDYEFLSADESVAVLEKTDNMDEFGRTEYIIRPLSPGNIPVLFVSKDPNDESRDLSVRVLGIKVCDNSALKKIITVSEMEMQPNEHTAIRISTDPDVVDPAHISFTSSDESIVHIERSSWNEYMYMLETFDKEGTATLTFSEGKVKATTKITVTRFVNTDKDYFPLTYVEGAAEQGYSDITVTLKGKVAGYEPVWEVWNTGENEEDHFPMEDPDDWPFTVEKISQNNDGTQFIYRVRPVREGQAQIRFISRNNETNYWADSWTHVDVRGLEKLRWAPWRLEEFNDPDRIWHNNEDIWLDLENGDAPNIWYQVFYTEDDTMPEGMPSTAEELLASENKLYCNRFLKVDSPYFDQSRMWIAAAAVKQGWATSDLLCVKLNVENDSLDGIWDDDYKQYIIDNNLTLTDLKGTLHVFGIPDEALYTGDKITFEDIRVWYGTHQLGEGMDYKVTYSNNVNPALSTAKKHPTIKITGMGEYTKSYTQAFSIVKTPVDVFDDRLAQLSVTASATSFVTTNKTKSVVPKLNVSLISPSGKKTALKANTDYTVMYLPIYSNDSGEYGYREHYDTPVAKIQVTDSKNYRVLIVPKATSTKISGFNLDNMDLESDVLQEYCLYYMPMIQVYYNAPDSPVTLLNMNDAKLSKSLGTLKLTYENGYDPEEIQKLFTEGKIKVKIGKQALRPAIIRNNGSPFPEVIEDGDYIIWAGNLRAGKNTLDLGGTYDFENPNPNTLPVIGSKQVSFNIAPILNITSKTAVVTGLVSSVALNEHNYFQLFSEWEDEEGNFRWDPDMNKLAVDGNASSIQLKDKKGNIIDPDNYNVYIDNYNGRLGSFKVVFEGRPEKGYTGKITKTVKIVAADLAELQNSGRLHVSFRDMDGPENTAEYSSSGAKPEIRVVVEMPWNPEHELSLGKDYTVTYKNNKTLGSIASVTIKGKGFYKGPLDTGLTFKIVQADLEYMHDYRSPLDAQAADIVYNAKGKANYWKSVPVIYDNGKALKKGKDYQILETEYFYGANVYDDRGVIIHSMDERIPDGAKVPLGAEIHVAAHIRMLNSNYTYSGNEDEHWIHMNYRIVTKAKKISSAKVKVNGGKAVYLGNNWDIVPPVTVTLGKVTLSEEDYEIVDIRNNWLIGTASMTIKGKGEYWGTKKITFKITKTPLK
ncbi:MAG: hypothetical protein IJJ44_08455 [Solobacterium sp.]|nr:hypothetical protein [Solobacterium sp.]